MAPQKSDPEELGKPKHSLDHAQEFCAQSDKKGNNRVCKNSTCPSLFDNSHRICLHLIAHGF